MDGWRMPRENLTNAVADLRGAAEFEESDREDPICVPAREMLADLLLELKRPKDALAGYRAVLKDYPNRFDALYGAARASEAAAESPASARLLRSACEDIFAGRRSPRTACGARFRRREPQLITALRSRMA